jgi:hypothetical protein
VAGKVGAASQLALWRERAWKSAKSDGLIERVGYRLRRSIETIGRGVGHLIYGDQAGAENKRQHDPVLNGGRTIVFTQQFFQEVHHGSYSIACCQRGFTSRAGMTRVASSGLCLQEKSRLRDRKCNLSPSKLSHREAAYDGCADKTKKAGD